MDEVLAPVLDERLMLMDGNKRARHYDGDERLLNY